MSCPSRKRCDSCLSSTIARTREGGCTPRAVCSKCSRWSTGTLKGKQIITDVYLEPEVYAALKKLRESSGAPMATTYEWECRGFLPNTA